MAMTDEGMTDEALVETLERIRIQRESSDTSAVWDVNQVTWKWNLQWEGGIDDKNRELSIPYTTSLPSFPLHHSLSVPPSPKLATAWHTARQALLTCRELVRTERHYLSSLTVLIASETVTLPPPLMIHYASQLAAVSQRFLTRLEADPSALGVAAAFLGIEEAVESAFVGWCGVVGTWFEAASSPIPSPKRRLSKGRSEEDIPEFGASAAHAGNGSLRRNGNSWRRNVPTMTSLNGSTSSPSQGLTPSFSYSFLNWRKDRSANGPSTNGNTKKPPVRDLAILPTQRVLRYVLIYRGLFQFFFTLLFHTNRDRFAGPYPFDITITGLGGKSSRSGHPHCPKMRPRSRQFCFSSKARAFVQNIPCTGQEGFDWVKPSHPRIPFHSFFLDAFLSRCQ